MGHQVDLERRIANLEKLIQVTRALREAFTLETLLNQIMNIIVELADCEKSSILLTDRKTGELRFASASGTQFDMLKDIVVPRQGSIAGTVVTTGKPVVVGNAQDDPRFFKQVDKRIDQVTETLMGVPMEIGGRIIGVLEALNKRNGLPFDDEDVETLLMFAPQAAAAIENTRLIEEQQQRLADNELIREVTLTLSRFIQREQLLGQLVLVLENDLDLSRFAVWVPDAEHENLVASIAKGVGEIETLPHFAMGDNNIIGQVALKQDSLLVRDLFQTPQPGALLADTRALLAVPMLCGDDMVGVISVESAQANEFSEREERILFEIALQTAIGIRQAELYEASLRANQLKQEFITTMSHELRTPMTVVIGSCEMIYQGALGAINAPQKETLKMALERANLLLRLLNDVLDFSKIASGDLKLYPSLVNVSSAIQAAVRKYQSYADRKRQPITIHPVPAECQHIIADDKRVRQILEHLVDNAIKFSPDERPIEIRTALHKDDPGYVCIQVIDQGIGIRPQDQTLVFEDFRQLDNSFTRDYGGAGMGLSISKHLVELQGGIIWVESEPDRGSTFSFILPRAQESSGQTMQMPIPDLDKDSKSS
ncbi:MAG: GAF domain-containing sensor histidine kinase [Anaerolineae bacterium]|nr:GAF domain-containing sensor histidine kinase [Anaerolineae bacterium]